MEQEYKNQREAIIAHMRRFGSIEPITALREYGIYRLAARICELRSIGYNIKTYCIDSFSKVTGKKVRFAKYILAE